LSNNDSDDALFIDQYSNPNITTLDLLHNHIYNIQHTICQKIT